MVRVVLAIVMTLAGAYTMVFLGGESASSRFLDFAKVVHWLDQR